MAPGPALPAHAPPPSPRLPGARTSCALLTVLTVLLAWPTETATLRVLVLPVYFALLTWFFWITGRNRSALSDQPMYLIRWGFFVLWLGFTASAVIHFSQPDQHHATFAYLREACENGALFLLGVTLIAYGLMLWIPRVIEANEILSRNLDEQKSELVVAESERDELEHRLLEADRRVLLGELAASVAHDLRNPLAIVVGAAESLCRRQRTPEEVAEHTDVIGRNIDKACRTLESLIDLGRPRAANPSRFDAAALAGEVFALVRTQARQRGIALTFRGGEAVSEIHSDRTLLAQALLNLLINAMDAVGTDSCITIRARRCGQGERAFTALAVEDRGPGVPQPVRMREFVPFHTTKPSGTGLGLWSCSRIAEELGSALALYPRQRGGARALLLLPATAAGISASGPGLEPTDHPEEAACPTAAS